jgi:hypothetical protein
MGKGAKTTLHRRGAKTGEFTTIKVARQHPSTHLVEGFRSPAMETRGSQRSRVVIASVVAKEQGGRPLVDRGGLSCAPSEIALTDPLLALVAKRRFRQCLRPSVPLRTSREDKP